MQKSRDQALAAERIRQRGLDQEADALNTQSQDRYQDIEGQQGERASQLAEYFTEQQIENATGNATAAQDMLVPQSGSSVTVREEEKQRGRADEFSDQQGGALGNLRAFGDLLGGIGRAQSRDAGKIGQIGGFKRGSSGIVPLELEQANSAGDGMRLFADVLGLGGSLATSAGLGGGVRPAGAARAAADPWNGLRTAGARPAGSNLFRLYG